MGLPLGTYDVIVVNPDGTVGTVVGGIVITPDQTPVVTSVVPNSMTGDTVSEINGMFLSPNSTVWIECSNPGVPTIFKYNVSSTFLSQTKITASFPLSNTQLLVAAVCIVVVQSPNGATFRYSAISKKSSSGNLYATWGSRSSFLEARQNHVMIGGQPTYTSRYLYIIGNALPLYPSDIFRWRQWYNSNKQYRSCFCRFVWEFGNLEKIKQFTFSYHKSQSSQSQQLCKNHLFLTCSKNRSIW